MMTTMLNLAAIAAAIAAGPQGASAARASLAGDWVLVGASTSGRLHLSPSGKEATLSLRDGRSEETIEARYQVSGTLGAVLALDRVGAAKPSSDGEPSLLRERARLLPISATVALWWQPHRRAVFAYRHRSVPLTLQGKYTIDKGETDIRAIEIGAESFAFRSADGDGPSEPIPIVAVTDADEESVRVALGGSAAGEVWRIELHRPRAKLVREVLGEQDTALEARFVPTAGGAKVARAGGTATSTRGEESPLPTLGEFRFSDLAHNFEAALTVSPSAWAVRPLGGSTGLLGAAEVTRKLADGAVRLMLRRGYGDRASITLRPLDPSFGEVWILDQYGEASVMYRSDAPPAWAPAAGLSDDVRLLCRELDAAGARLDDGTVRAAFERVGRSARSDVMRTLIEAIVVAPADFRAALLERGLVDAGEPIPVCAGVDRLRAQPGRRRAPSDD